MEQNPHGTRKINWGMVGGVGTAVGVVVALLAWLIPQSAATSSESSSDASAPADGTSSSASPTMRTAPVVPTTTTTTTTASEPSWPGEPVGSLFITGSPVLDLSGDDSLDFDENEIRWNVHATSDFDLIGSNDGAGAQNGAAFALWQGKQQPTLRDCRSVTEEQWVPTITVDRFEAPSIYCIRSTEQRMGYLQTQSVIFWDDRGDVRTLSMNYVLWKKPGDR